MLYHPAFGAISDEISANGVESQVVFDGLGRARKTSRAGETPVFIYSGPRTNVGGKLIGSYVDTSGTGVVSTHSEYDEYGRALLQQHVGFDGTAIYRQTKYDSLGRLQSVTRSGFGQPAATGTTYAYDGLNRVLSITPPDGNATISKYTFFEAHVFDAVKHESYSVRDLDGRVVKSAGMGDNNVVAAVMFQYGNFNQIKSITDSQNNVSRIYYDQRGRRVNLSDPDAGASTFHYNGFGDLTELDVPGINGSVVPAQTFYKRDALGRVVHIDNADGATDFTWDTSPYGIGLLASQSSPSVAQTFEYDWYGRPSKETWTVAKESFDMLTSYDGSGRVSTVSYPEVPGRNSRFTVQRSYSSTNYLANVSEVDLPTPVKFWEVQARNADDQLLQGQFGNGRLSKRAYEPTMGRLKSITDMACVGGNCVGADFSLGYTYLNDGNVESRTDSVTGRAETFGYDALNRLTAWDLTYSGNTRKTGYKYDDIGNLTDVTVAGVPSATESNTPYPSGACSAPPGAPCPGPHALQSAIIGGVTQTFGYDTRGRQINAPGRHVAFSEANLPTLVDTSAGSTVFLYDAAGSRVKKVGPSEETLTLGGLYERRVTKGGTKHVFFVSGGDGNMTQVSFTEGTPNSDRIEYLHTDALGSTAAVTDDTGGVTRSYREPFGARIDANGSSFSGTLGDVRRGFTGHDSDDDLMLVNMKGRIYDPSQRRFISPDPLVSAPAKAQSYNRYSYVWNNPLSFTDPSGFESGAPAPTGGDPPQKTFTGEPAVKTKNDGSVWSQGGGGPGGNVTQNGAPATPYKAASAQGQNAGTSIVLRFFQAIDDQLALADALEDENFDAPIVKADPFWAEPENRQMARNYHAFYRVTDTLAELLWSPEEAAAAWGIVRLTPAVASVPEAATVAKVTEDVAAVPVVVEGATESGSVGAFRATDQFFNTNPDSVPTWGHTFLRHGEGNKKFLDLVGRAGGVGGPQGQWLNNEMAADILAAYRPYVEGASVIPIPPGVGRVVLPSGKTVPALFAEIWPHAKGGYITAFPVIP
jgi:RHS repeat-associated protein